MPVIKIEMLIKAPIEICFNLSSSIDLHKISTRHTEEKVIAGVNKGLIHLNETVTWRAKHFGIWQNLTSKITILNFPHHFTDEMLKGAFKSFKHKHYFKEVEGGTLMTDFFEFTSPFGILGKIADAIFLEKYMYKLLMKRNMIIKEFAETDLWKQVL